MFAWFEGRIDPFRPVPEGRPPDGLLAFYWHFARQVWPALVICLILGVLAATVEVALFAFLGDLVDLLGEAESPAAFFDKHWVTLLWMGFVALIARPVVFGLHAVFINQAMVPSFTNLVRWQTHRYVLRQSLGFFQDDFAGRIAQRVMQTGPSLRESVIEVVDALWFVVLYALAALILFADADWRLILPLCLWLAGFVCALVYFVPRIRDRSAIMSDARSALAGRVVDSYTNILTVKLFAHADREEAYAKEALLDHTAKFRDQLRLTSWLEIVVYSLNGFLITGTGIIALWLWGAGAVSLGAVALALGLTIRIMNMAGWAMWVVTGIFENIGTVQEGMKSIARDYDIVDAPMAQPLEVTSGHIRFEDATFHYGKDGGVIEALNLEIAPGEKVGLVGRSGAGKSTLVNLLLRFYDLERGRILIDGQDIALVDQESLRAQIGMVTQDTSLLHRSVQDNIRYGAPDAGIEAVRSMAGRAYAAEFIPGLVDFHGRTGFEAHVGERGVKLSGGQRQRIAIARVLLKNAPILLLDEATSALDSEVEQAIQEQLNNLMQGKTVIAIAHRLSTIAAMDRLVIMDRGAVVEMGSHQALLAKGGLYADLWRRQSGGFLAAETAA